jgi:antitoxin Xre/MbcA/ParS-like protein
VDAAVRSGAPGDAHFLWSTLKSMGSLHGAVPTPAEQLAAQLEHPNAKAIWNRALEVFGEEAKARSWMNTPRDNFDGRTPQDLVATGDIAEQRRVLEVLLRIDYGVFS